MTENVFEVTFVESGRTVEWTRTECEEHFGREEFLEVEQGYAPHIVAVNISE